MYPLSCANTHKDVKNFGVDGTTRDAKHWISWEGSITFHEIKEFFNCTRETILPENTVV